MYEDLKGKVALVTGGDRGIGQAIVAQLAAAGCDVLVHAREMSPMSTEAAQALRARYGVTCTPLAADFLDPDRIAAMFATVDGIAPRLDILVNNAGFETTFAAEDMRLGDWAAVLQVNLNAPFQCSQEAARRMKRTGSGVIVNIASMHDSVPRKGLSHYCAAKAALRMLSRCTALEWAEYGIRVVTVSPGAIETDMNRDAIEAFGRHNFEAWIPSGRLGRTSDVSGLVAFLCSEAGSYITGTEIYVDGGYMHNLVRYDDRPGRNLIG